jgi:hypothetical protein
MKAQGVWRYSCNLSLTSALGGVRDQRHASAALPLGNRSDTRCVIPIFTRECSCWCIAVVLKYLEFSTVLKLLKNFGYILFFIGDRIFSPLI